VHFSILSGRLGPTGVGETAPAPSRNQRSCTRSARVNKDGTGWTPLLSWPSCSNDASDSTLCCLAQDVRIVNHIRRPPNSCTLRFFRAGSARQGSERPHQRPLVISAHARGARMRRSSRVRELSKASRGQRLTGLGIGLSRPRLALRPAGRPTMSLKWHERLSVRAIEFHQSLRRHLQPFLRPGASSVLIIGSVYAAAQLLKSLADCLRDEPEWRGIVRVVPIEPDEQDASVPRRRRDLLLRCTCGRSARPRFRA